MLHTQVDSLQIPLQPCPFLRKSHLVRITEYVSGKSFSKKRVEDVWDIPCTREPVDFLRNDAIVFARREKRVSVSTIEIVRCLNTT